MPWPASLRSHRPRDFQVPTTGPVPRASRPRHNARYLVGSLPHQTNPPMPRVRRGSSDNSQSPTRLLQQRKQSTTVGRASAFRIGRPDDAIRVQASGGPRLRPSLRYFLMVEESSQHAGTQGYRLLGLTVPSLTAHCPRVWATYAPRIPAPSTYNALQ